MNAPHKTITLKIDPEKHRQIKVHAADTGQSIKDLFLRCFDRMINEADQAKKPESK